MLSVKSISFLLVFMVICKILNCDAIDTNNYGSYKVDYDYFEYCGGPKSKNVTRYTIDLIKERDDYILKVNFTFLEQCYIDEIKITVYSANGKIKNQLVNYKLTDPCHHFAVGNMLELYFNATKCLVKKGTYLPHINLSEVSKLFLSSAFFYGDFLMKTNMLSKKGNICCFVIHSIFTRKHNK